MPAVAPARRCLPRRRRAAGRMRAPVIAHGRREQPEEGVVALAQVVATDNAGNTAAPLAAALRVGSSAGETLVAAAPSSARPAASVPAVAASAAAGAVGLAAVVLWLLLR